MSSFHWVANKNITVGSGTGTSRMEGEPVPEADTWKDPDMWERGGHIRKVPGPAPKGKSSSNILAAEKYTKTRLQKMRKADLIDLAANAGVDTAGFAKPKLINVILNTQ